MDLHVLHSSAGQKVALQVRLGLLLGDRKPRKSKRKERRQEVVGRCKLSSAGDDCHLIESDIGRLPASSCTSLPPSNKSARLCHLDLGWDTISCMQHMAGTLYLECGRRTWEQGTTHSTVRCDAHGPNKLTFPIPSGCFWKRTRMSLAPIRIYQKAS